MLAGVGGTLVGTHIFVSDIELVAVEQLLQRGCSRNSLARFRGPCALGECHRRDDYDRQDRVRELRVNCGWRTLRRFQSRMHRLPSRFFDKPKGSWSATVAEESRWWLRKAAVRHDQFDGSAQT